MTVERKVIAFEQAAVDPSTGEGRGYGAVFGNRDDGGDIIQPGFFEPVIPDFLKSGFISWAHDWADPVAMPTDAAEDDRGLDIKWQFHSTPRAQEARQISAERLEKGKDMGLSIGYEVDEEKQTPEGRLLIRAKRLFEVALVMVPMNRLAKVTELKALKEKQAIAPHETATTDDAWDAGANEANLSNDAGAAAYKRAYAWQDPDGDPDTKAAYKFIHHMVSFDGTVGAANLTACSAGIAVLNGGRGGTTIPDGDRQGVWNHLAAHLRDADREPPELRGKGLGPDLAYADHLDLVAGEVRSLVERTDKRLAIRAKEGRELSDANRRLIAEVAKLLDELLARTAPAPKGNAVVRARKSQLMQTLIEHNIHLEEIAHG